MLKKLTILTTVLILALFIGNASARTFVVDPGGDPAEVFLDLTTAINTAATWPGDGHIIEIVPGEYSDYGLTCPTNVAEITGMNGERTGVIFTDPIPGTHDFMDLSGTTGLIISGLTIIGYDHAFVTASSIATSLNISGCIFDGNNYAFYMSSYDGLFDGLEIFNGGFGFYIYDVAGGSALDDNTITGCTIYDMTGFGVRFFGAAAASMNNNTVIGCTVFNCQDWGILLGTGGGVHSGSVVTGNTVYDCYFEGIILGGNTGSDHTVSDNEVYGCANATMSGTGSPRTPFGGVMTSGAAVLSDNVIYNNGDGVGVGDYGLYVTGSVCNITGNCLYGHANAAQAFDNTGANTWDGNYFGAYVSIPHGIDGMSGMQDNNPKTFNNSAYADPTTWEIYPDLNDEYVVEFKWTKPDCEPWEETYLAYYEFQVNFDDAMLEYVSGSAEYDETAFGPMDGSTGALYAPIGTGTGTITFAAGNDAAPYAGDFVMARATFRGIDVGTTSIWITSTYLDDNEVSLTVVNTSLSITVADTQAPSIVSVTGPAVVTDDNAPYYFDTYFPRVKLMIEAQAIDNFDLRRIRYNVDGGTSYTLIGGLGGTSGGTTTPILIPTEFYSEGSHTLNVWAEDQPLNPSAVYAFPFEIDRTGPVLDAFDISDADGCAPTDGYTNDATVTASLTNSDMTAVKRQMHDGSGWAAPIDYTPTGGVDDFALVGPTTGTTCYARLYDAVGNSIQWLSDDIIFDDVAPVPSAFIINSGAAKTKNPVLSCDANFNAGGGAIEYNVSDDEGDLVCGDAGWTGWLISPPHPFGYDFTGADDGPLDLYFAVRDDAGNISAILHDDIILDTDAPEMTSLTLDDCINDYYNPEVTITWDDDDVDKAYFTINGNSDAAYEFTITDPSTHTETFTFPYFLAIHILEDDVNVISGYLEDDIGNVGDPIADVEFFYDETDPTVTGITLSESSARTDPPKHADYSATTMLDVDFTGLADDITEIHISETNAFAGEEVVYTVSGPFAGGEYTVTHEYGTAGGTVGECGTKLVYAMVFDCSGRSGGPVSDGIKFDFTDPVITDVTITSADPTNNLAIDLAITASDNCIWWKMNIYEDGGVGTAETGWINDAGTYTYTLDAGDGTRNIMVEVADASGHTASFGPISVVVDQAPPTQSGAYLEQPISSNPHVTPGYTNDRSDVQVVMGTYSDAVKVYFAETATAQNSGWQEPIPATFAIPWTLAGGQGVKTIDMLLMDAAGNNSGWIPLTIIFDNIAPSAPGAGTVTGTPGGSCMLEIDPPVTDVNKYYARFNYSTQYPTYGDWVDLAAKPPFPDLGTGNGWFFFDEGATTYDFTGPQMDIYSFSIWSYDMAGNISTSCNTDVTATNYVLSDLDNDGVVNFGADLGALSSSYDTYSIDSFFDVFCDYGPKVDELPQPNGYIGFDELVIAVGNYAVFGDWLTKRGDDIEIIHHPHKLAPELIVSTEMPCRLLTGDVCTISLNCNNPGAVAAFHMILGFDKDKIQITDINSGQMFNTEEKKFFYQKVKGDELWIDGAIFGGEAKFANNEIAQISFEAKNNVDLFSLDDVVIDFRDINGEEIPVTFEVKKTIENVIPKEFSLRQNYPNPFNPSTTIEMALPVATSWTIAIYNVAGQKVSELNGFNEAGIHNVVWEATDQASGIYFYKIIAGDFRDTKKMVLLK